MWSDAGFRSLSPFQKKILQAFADDVEGRDPNVYFGAPPPPPSPAASGTSEGANHFSSSSPSSSSSTSTPPSSSSPLNAPPIEPERRLSPDHQDDTSPGVGGKVASVLGGVIGLAEHLFGGGKR